MRVVEGHPIRRTNGGAEAIPAEAEGARRPVAGRLDGLTSEEAARRLAADGPNEIAARAHASVARLVFERFANPLVLILAFASVASAVLREFADAAIILAVLASSIVIEVFQTRRSARAAEALRARVAQTATVLRDGAWCEIPRREVVAGDVVKLSAGDMVPADGALVEEKDLHVNEAALTGESLPVEKTCDAQAPRDATSVRMGSSVVSGTGTFRVEAIGEKTTFGEIARSVARHPPQTEFERGITRFGAFILKTVLALVIFVFAVTAALHKDALESLLFAVALAVGLTPEFLPMITTITLTRGAVRMSRAKVIVKNLAAIQNFGSMDVLLSDKTGTLTTGEMTLERHVDPFGAEAERPLLLASVNSYFESGVENALDVAVLAKARIDPLDSAVLRHEHPDLSGWRKVDEVPFDFERRRVSVVAERADEVVLITKGAPEHVLAVSTSYEADGEIRPLDDAARARATAAFETLCRAGYRVLGVASRPSSTGRAFGREDECALTLAGFLAFVDPPRPDAGEMLRDLAAEGITVKVLTGDSELVAATVCERVGIDPKSILTGREIDAMSDPALAHHAERVQVFARVSPTQKNRILRALKTRGHVVGFMGDGINDAPSIHAADVGISVSGAVDVAREAAEVILVEPGLRVLLAGVIEGRKAYGNVMKYLLMGTSSNFGNMVSMAVASVFLPFLPMLPVQILLNNFLYDLAQVTIPSDNVDAAFVQKPHRWDIGLIRRFMLWVGPVSSLYDFATFYALRSVLHAGEALFHSGWFVESLATQTLVIFVIRTAGPLRASRPSRALVATTLTVVLVAVALPFSPFAHVLGFEPLPAAFFGFLAFSTLTYLTLVELVKRRLMRRALA